VGQINKKSKNITKSKSISTNELETCKEALNKAQFKADILDLIPTPVMVIDKEYNIKYMNPAGANALNRAVEDCLGKKCYSLFNTEHCNTTDCQLKKAMEKNNIFTSDTVASLPGGALPIRYTGSPLKDSNGNIIGALEFILDIRKEIEVTDGVLELVDAAVDGRLDKRANIAKYEGNYRRIIQGINETLDAVIGPLNVAAEYIYRISKGDIPELITDEYKGDFNEIKNNLNQCIESIDGLVNEAAILADSAAEGRLERRSNVNNFNGDYARIIEGFNSSIDTLVGHINQIPTPVMIIDNEFNIRFMNKAGADILGKSIEQLLGHKCYEYFKTSDCNTSNCACNRAMKSGNYESSETDAHPGNHNLFIKYNAVPVKDRACKTIGALEIVIGSDTG
jgi:methyl-accepting chemotaxis protein